MAEYRVMFDATASLGVTVVVPDLEDPEEEREAAIEAAYDSLPSGPCAKCTGWGQNWGMDVGEWELSEWGDRSEVVKLDE